MLRSTILFCALTGSQVIAAPENRDLGQRLDHHLSVTWQGQQLGNALDRLEDLGRVPIWLDRRVDPNQTINLSAQELSLGNTLAKLAQAASGEVALVERLVYFGPQGAALEIATIREEFRASLGKVPSPVRSRWLERATWSWPRLSEPRTILHDLFSSTKIELHELDRLPHDLWPAQQLPPLALIDRAILVLYGFDLKLQIDADGKSCQLVPIERPWMIRQRTPVAAKRRPAAKQSDHKDGPASRSAQKVYSLRIREKSVGNVLRQLAKQLHLELQWDEKKLAVAGRTLDRRISCEVDSATLDQLLESVLTPAGLQYKREGTVVRIEAAE